MEKMPNYKNDHGFEADAKEIADDLISRFRKFERSAFTTSGKEMAFAHVKMMAIECAEYVGNRCDYERDELLYHRAIQIIKETPYTQQ